MSSSPGYKRKRLIEPSSKITQQDYEKIIYPQVEKVELYVKWNEKSGRFCHRRHSKT